jgi:rhamnogalacturonan endolyase
MTKFLSFSKSIALFSLILMSQNTLFAQRKMEKLDRGVVAIRTSPTAVYVGWRLLGNDTDGVTFNVYRGATKINATPIAATTNIVDATPTDAIYTVRPVVSGVEKAASKPTSVLSNPYIDIPIDPPTGGITPDGVDYTYNANDASVADLDGDGEYEVVLKWDPSNAKDNSQSGYTGNVFIDAYKLNGTRLWRINLGKNIRAGAHYTQFMVYDFDSDGKAEMTCRTSAGTIDGIGKPIDSLNHNADYRTTAGYVLSGPEYQTVFNGQTGAAMASVNYIPARGTVSSWGDSYGNRVDRFVDVVAYLDGKQPSFITGRGYYTRLVRVAWNWRGGQLTKVWEFDTNTAANAAFMNQGNHNMSIGDMDNDGKDEICNGASAIDNDGKPFYNTTLGHGDALHMSDLDPDHAGMEVWQSHEEPARYGAYGLEFRDAKTGTPLWGVDGAGKDIGRCMTADIDPRYKGSECWGATGGLYSCKGQLISTARPSSMNFGIWWDADLTRELLDGNKVLKWNYVNSTTATIYTADSCSSNNGTKATPSVSADIFGDWREEFILRKTDNTALRIFTTTIPANNRLITLMHDPQYRAAVAWQNSAYNQPPHPSFYLGDSMLPPLRPNIDVEPLATSTQNVEKIDIAKIFPNPSVHGFTIEIQGDFDYKIVDLSGKLRESGRGKERLVVGSKLEKGLFIVSVFQNGQEQMLKIVKE